jgi:hypothetical protein
MGIFNKSRRRAIAPFVLGLWLFALVSSMAHACGLVDEPENAGLNSTPATVAHEQGSDDTLSACGQFCADDIPLPSKIKSVEDSPAASAFLVNASFLRLCLPASREPMTAVAGPDPPPAIAVNTRFVRLAL